MADGIGWEEARALAAGVPPLPVRSVPLRLAVGGVLAEDALAPRPVPHYDSSAMDGWAVAGPPPWRVVSGAVRAGEACALVTGGLLPDGAEAVVPVERAVERDGVVDGPRPPAGAHLRRAGEETPAGGLLAAAGRRLSPADVAVLSIAGLDAVPARPRPRVGIVLTGDEVVAAGRPAPGRVRDAFDPLVPLAVAGLGATALPPERAGDDPGGIAAALAASDADVLVTTGGTGRSRADRLREAIAGARTVFDGVAMRPGHPALLAVLPDGRPLLALPGNPLAAVTVLLSFLPPLLAGLTGTEVPAPASGAAAVALPGWAGGTALLPCAGSPGALRPAAATRPNMLRGLAASTAIAIVPPGGATAGGPVRLLPLPW